VARSIALLILLVLVACAAWWRGWLEGIDPEAVGALVRSAGAWGPALFLLLFSVGNGLGAPGFLFLFPAAVLWPPWEALLLNWAGCNGAGWVGYAFARSVGRHFVEAHLPRRLRALDHRIGQRAVESVAAVRLTLFLATPAHWALGLSSVTLRPLLLGSALGFLPPAAVWTFAGRGLMRAIHKGHASAWLGLLALIVVSLAVPAWMSRGRTGAVDPG
jgi:uncharacterized membrane protein YdjX (TVP38/TMEM64 family)